MDDNNHPVTKKELKQALNDWTCTEIAPVVESIFEKHKGDIVDEVRKIKDEIVKSNDNLVGEIKKDREESMATVMSSKTANEKYKEYDELFKKHNLRIHALELQPA